ncbi:GntR family transcriptional regulator [Streptomyces telluris]|uniref:GntR family transcriptional regulator n=1 Tax=Streptomyces telluris TaxID=2720021 RepID=A0A9X2LJ64_9ACTN|nr:GntR family transcriptional regulator [Streptomyces telluris]MCQ8772262.1 GntR family transcriptional regulator [Streptomyces telluris]NJP75737.1 GntR family transcriptional regulator [Streptomyces telluris]
MPEQPPYLRVADLLRQRIADQEWAPGDRLPSRGQLAQECGGVGVNVVRRAQELLISQGVLEGHSGSGTYVAEPRPRLRMVRSQLPEGGRGAPCVTDVSALGKGGTWESSTDAKVPAPAGIAARLHIAEGDLCVRTAYEFMLDGKPVQLLTSWEPYGLTAHTLVVLPEGGPYSGKGVVHRMAEIGITVAHAVEEVEGGSATAEEATLLGVQRGAVVTRIERTYYSDDGRPVETADIVTPAALGKIVYKVPVR